MMRCSWGLDPMRKFKIDSRLLLPTNRLVSLASKIIDETIFLRSCMEIQNPCHLHRNLNPQDLGQVAPLRKKMKKYQNVQKGYLKK
jgi:hypothetical protein